MTDAEMAAALRACEAADGAVEQANFLAAKVLASCPPECRANGCIEVICAEPYGNGNCLCWPAIEVRLARKTGARPL